MIAYRVELWCSGDCFTRFLQTLPTHDLSKLPQLALNLTAIATRGGWTPDGTAMFCPRCTRQRKDEDQAQSVANYKEQTRRAAKGAR